MKVNFCTLLAVMILHWYLRFSPHFQDLCWILSVSRSSCMSVFLIRFCMSL